MFSDENDIEEDDGIDDADDADGKVGKEVGVDSGTDTYDDDDDDEDAVSGADTAVGIETDSSTTWPARAGKHEAENSKVDN